MFGKKKKAKVIRKKMPKRPTESVKKVIKKRKKTREQMMKELFKDW